MTTPAQLLTLSGAAAAAEVAAARRAYSRYLATGSVTTMRLTDRQHAEASARLERAGLRALVAAVGAERCAASLLHLAIHEPDADDLTAPEAVARELTEARAAVAAELARLEG